MKTSMLSLLLCALAFEPAIAHAFCDDLTAGAAKATGYVIAPIECKADPKDCAEVEQRIAKCLGKGGGKVVTPQALQAAVGEAALKDAQGKGNLNEITMSFGTKRLAVASVKDKVALVRVINAETGEVASAARLSLTSDDPNASLQPATLNAGLRRLGDRLAASFKALPGAGKKRVAVLPFKESGEQATKNNVGTLIAAELVTRFQRDYGFTVVERSRLDAVLKEMELGQMGLIDEKNAPKLGQLVEADVIVLGTALDAGAAVKVYAQVIDVVSGVTLVADNSELPTAGFVTLSSNAVVLRSKSGALFRSLLIPGWGQIYNQQPIKGGVFLGVAIALGGTAALMQGLSAMTAGQYARATSNFDALATRAESFQYAAIGLVSGLAAFWIYNIIDAYVSGVTFDSAVSTGSSSASY